MLQFELQAHQSADSCRYQICTIARIEVGENLIDRAAEAIDQINPGGSK